VLPGKPDSIMSRTFTISSPHSSSEFLKYYDLRWRILRSPWQQLKGSEQDELEDAAFHIMAMEKELIVAVGRLHFINDNSAQIRYMAVESGYEGRGYGTAILTALENHAASHSIKNIVLDAREKAIGFYQKNAYEVIKESHILYGEIRHFRMKRELF
jgi:ribosomal protein S18 acetylase RimI-like enzyme